MGFLKFIWSSLSDSQLEKSSWQKPGQKLVFFIWWFLFSVCFYFWFKASQLSSSFINPCYHFIFKFCLMIFLSTVLICVLERIACSHDLFLWGVGEILKIQRIKENKDVLLPEPEVLHGVLFQEYKLEGWFWRNLVLAMKHRIKDLAPETIQMYSRKS